MGAEGVAFGSGDVDQSEQYLVGGSIPTAEADDEKPNQVLARVTGVRAVELDGPRKPRRM